MKDKYKAFKKACEDICESRAIYHTENMSVALDVATVLVKYHAFRPKTQGLSGEDGRKKHLKKIFKIVESLIH